MPKLNYELLYKVRHGRFNTNSLDNLKIQFRIDADKKAEAEHQRYRDFLAKELGTDDFIVTNIACLGADVIGHVFTPARSRRGGIDQRCVFCGCDNVDY